MSVHFLQGNKMSQNPRSAVSVQVAPFCIANKDANFPQPEVQLNGADQETAGHSVHVRFDDGVLEHIADRKLEADAVVIAKDYAKKLGVPIEQPAWVASSSELDVGRHRLTFPRTAEAQIKKQVAYARELKELLHKAFRDGVVLSITSANPFHPVKGIMPEGYCIHQTVMAIPYTTDTYLEMPSGLEATTISMHSNGKDKGDGTTDRHYLGQYMPRPGFGTPEQAREYSNELFNEFAATDIGSSSLDPALLEGGTTARKQMFGSTLAETPGVSAAFNLAAAKPDTNLEHLNAIGYPIDPWAITGSNRKQMFKGISLKNVVGTSTGETAFSEGVMDHCFGNMTPTPVDVLPLVRASQSKMLEIKPKFPSHDGSGEIDLTEELKELMTGAEDQEDFNAKMDAFCEKYPGIKEQLAEFIETNLSNMAIASIDEQNSLEELIDKTKSRMAEVTNGLVQSLIDEHDAIKALIKADEIPSGDKSVEQKIEGGVSYDTEAPVTHTDAEMRKFAGMPEAPAVDVPAPTGAEVYDGLSKVISKNITEKEVITIGELDSIKPIKEQS